MMTSRRGMPTSTTQHMADMIVHVYEPTCIHRMYDSHTPLVYGGYGKMFGQRHSDTLNMVERSDSDQTKSPIKHTCLIGATPIKQKCLIGATPIKQTCLIGATPIKQTCLIGATPIKQTCLIGATPIKQTCLIGATPIKQTCLIGATPVNQHHVDMMICATTNLNCRINSDMM